jgi:hypothetical protein
MLARLVRHNRGMKLVFAAALLAVAVLAADQMLVLT